MGKRKIFTKSDVATVRIEYTRDDDGRVTIPPGITPPSNTVVSFGRIASSRRRFDFSPWYSVDIDPITYACQRQIERFLDKQDSDVEITTVSSYCAYGLKNFLDYLVLVSAALRRPLTLGDITRDMVDGYLGFLRDKGLSTASQQTTYNFTKSVLVALGRRSLIDVVHRGDYATFPTNPFPGSHRHNKGETPELSSNLVYGGFEAGD